MKNDSITNVGNDTHLSKIHRQKKMSTFMSLTELLSNKYVFGFRVSEFQGFRVSGVYFMSFGFKFRVWEDAGMDEEDDSTLSIEEAVKDPLRVKYYNDYLLSLAGAIE